MIQISRVFLLSLLFYFNLAEIAKPNTINIKEEWKQWKKQYGKQYSTDDELEKFQIWGQNYQIIKNHNLNQSEFGFSLRLNQFGDLDYKTNHYFLNISHLKYSVENLSHLSAKYIPDSWDWREKGAVTPVIDQGISNVANAIPITGSVESYHKINGGELFELSFIELEDCCSNFTEPSCDGKMLLDPWNCIIKMNGLCKRMDYKRKPNCDCNKESCEPTANIKGYKEISKGDEESLKIAVFHNPVSVYVDASHTSFQFYQQGVYYEPDCQSSLLDHGLLIVGYGTLYGRSYWLCKNSWGTSWGMQGYIMMARNQNNNCGIATAASYPV